MTTNIPRYAIIGIRPVKLVQSEEEGLRCLALDWQTGEFIDAPQYLSRISDPSDVEVDVVDQEEFEEHVERQQARIAAKSR